MGEVLGDMGADKKGEDLSRGGKYFVFFRTWAVRSEWAEQVVVVSITGKELYEKECWWRQRVNRGSGRVDADRRRGSGAEIEFSFNEIQVT